MKNESKHRKRRYITLDECRINWNHYPIENEDGTIVYETISETLKAQWKRDECGYSACGRVRAEKCIDYFEFEYDKSKLQQYYLQQHWTQEDIIWAGLTDMFNDGWLKSAAYVDWNRGLLFCIQPDMIEDFLASIPEPAIRVDILQFIVDNKDYILPGFEDQYLFYRYLLSVHQADLRVHLENQDDIAFIQSYKPREKDYNGIRLYIEARKRTDIDFKNYCDAHSFNDLCRYLENELGIVINTNSLQRNIRREMRKRKKGQ